MKIVFLGDIVGRTGRDIIKTRLSQLREKYSPDFIIANGENLASGLGITEKTYREMIDAGIDALTSGNHIFDRKDGLELIENENSRLIIPLNYPATVKGNRVLELNKNGKKLTLINVCGRVFMDEIRDCPFQSVEKFLASLGKNEIILVDFHGEATSEKLAFADYFDGKINIIVGTHTHVQTSDAQILPNGAAYITDAGMTGAIDSILGDEKQPIVNHFLTGKPFKVEVADHPAKVEGVYIEIDDKTKKVLKIEAFRILEN